MNKNLAFFLASLLMFQVDKAAQTPECIREVQVLRKELFLWGGLLCVNFKKAFGNEAGFFQTAYFYLADQTDNTVGQIINTCITDNPHEAQFFTRTVQKMLEAKKDCLKREMIISTHVNSALLYQQLHLPACSDATLTRLWERNQSQG